MREYRYVGSSDLLENLPTNSGRVLLTATDVIIKWIKETNQPYEYDNVVVATFIVDTDKQMWINDRRSEHVRCAHGGNVLSAGEITFEVDKDNVEVIEITNQSTGYCPEPESWWAVKEALQETDILFPANFTTKFIFRMCEKCGTKNIIKDDWYECGVCQEVLSSYWNFDKGFGN